MNSTSITHFITSGIEAKVREREREREREITREYHMGEWMVGV